MAFVDAVMTNRWTLVQMAISTWLVTYSIRRRLEVKLYGSDA
jgi:hypothetical protein